VVIPQKYYLKPASHNTTYIDTGFGLIGFADNKAKVKRKGFITFDRKFFTR
jgi:hypothetical protein